MRHSHRVDVCSISETDVILTCPIVSHRKAKDKQLIAFRLIAQQREAEKKASATSSDGTANRLNGRFLRDDDDSVIA